MGLRAGCPIPLAQAVTRGVENGFTIVRSAQEGFVTFSDAYGRILDEQSSAADPMLVQNIPTGPGATLYTRYGDWFAWTNVVMLGGLLLCLAIVPNSNITG